jgi:transposase
VFFGRRRQAIKVFFFDGTGLCVFYKRLDKGTFRLPTNYDPQSRSVAINERMLEELLSGIDLDIPTTH